MNRVCPFRFCCLLFLMAIATGVPQIPGKLRRRSKCEWVLVQAARSWYSDEPGPADYEIRSGHAQYSPMAQINREWNHSQGAGESPLARKFARPEVMIHVKCNIHSWMQAYIGVVDNPYFAVSGEDGSYPIENLPPGTYTVSRYGKKNWERRSNR